MLSLEAHQLCDAIIMTIFELILKSVPASPVHSERLSSRTSFQLEDEVLETYKPLFGSVQTPNIIVFILVFYANRVEGSLGHYQTLIWKCPTVQFSQIFPLFLIFGS